MASAYVKIHDAGGTEEFYQTPGERERKMHMRLLHGMMRNVHDLLEY